MSPEQYARRVGCSGGTVRRVERGYTPFLHNQIKFAAALEMEREDLWGLPPIAEVRDRVRVAA